MRSIILAPSKVSDSKTANGFSRRSLFKWGLLGFVARVFGSEKALANFVAAAWEDDPEWLARWRAASRQPVWESSDAELQVIIRAVRLNQDLQIQYFRGSSPGEARLITPSLVFTCEGYSGVWVSAYCHVRQQERTFRVDCISLKCRADAQ